MLSRKSGDTTEGSKERIGKQIMTRKSAVPTSHVSLHDLIKKQRNSDKSQESQD